MSSSMVKDFVEACFYVGRFHPVPITPCPSPRAHAPCTAVRQPTHTAAVAAADDGADSSADAGPAQRG
eukprot:gene19953-36895_t